MRLLIIVPNIISYDFLSELCRSLIAGGTEVHLACAPDSTWGMLHDVAKDGVQRHDIEFARGMNPVRHLRAARALDQLVERLRPDVIHVNFSAAIFTTALARTRRWPTTIGTFHGVCFPALTGWKARLLRVMETWAAQRLDGVWVLTDDDRACLRAAAPQAVVRTLPGMGLGCDIERFVPASESAREAFRAKLGLHPGDIAFIFVGRFVDFKGFAVAIRAFLKLAAVNPLVRLLLVGARDGLHPTGLTPGEEQELKHSAQILDLGFRLDVPECLAAADVMIFPSRREGMPVCLMEALAVGLPAITLDSRGCREVVRDGIDGLLIREPGAEPFFEAMRRAAGDADLRRRWSARAIADRERFDRRRYIAEQKLIYSKCAEADSKSHPLLVLARNALKRFRTNGPRHAIWLIHARLRALVRSFSEDRRRGLSTAGAVREQEPEIADSRCHWYAATDYATFELAMSRVAIRPGEDVFVDLGAGKGRGVILAAHLPFRKVIGVEFSKQLHAMAEANLLAALPELSCRNVELILTDATQWQIPDEATILFLFNPFHGEVLAKVCANIRRSLQEAPRKVTIVYVRPEKFFEREIEWQSWLTRRTELRCLEGKVAIYESIGAECAAAEPRGEPALRG